MRTILIAQVELTLKCVMKASLWSWRLPPPCSLCVYGPSVSLSFTRPQYILLVAHIAFCVHENQFRRVLWWLYQLTVAQINETIAA